MLLCYARPAYIACSVHVIRCQQWCGNSPEKVGGGTVTELMHLCDLIRIKNQELISEPDNSLSDFKIKGQE